MSRVFYGHDMNANGPQFHNLSQKQYGTVSRIVPGHSKLANTATTVTIYYQKRRKNTDNTNFHLPKVFITAAVLRYKHQILRWNKYTYIHTYIYIYDTVRKQFWLTMQELAILLLKRAPWCSTPIPYPTISFEEEYLYKIWEET